MPKVALVTGASRGIGKVIAAHLALRGLDVALAARSVSERDVTPYPGTIHATAALVESLGARALPLRCDIGVEAEVEAAVERALDHFGRVDVLVNNARYEGPAMWDDFAASAWSEIGKLLDCNVRAPLRFMHLLAPAMRAQGGGLVINITTTMDYHLDPAYQPGKGATTSLYPSTKAHLNWATMMLARELRRDKIAVIGAHPGSVLTERVTTQAMGAFDPRKRYTAHVPGVIAAHLATLADPMAYTGKILDDPLGFVREHGLMAEADITYPFREDPSGNAEVYDPFSEPFWRRSAGQRR